MGIKRNHFKNETTDYQHLRSAPITVNGTCIFRFVKRSGRRGRATLALYRCEHCGAEREFAIATTGSRAA